MTLKTATRLAPVHHGRRITDEELSHADFVPGYKYEIIEGRLYVSYEPDYSENRYEDWLHFKLKLYALEHPEVINYAARKARVFLPGPRQTIPEPDVVAYKDVPLDLPFDEVNWQELSPILVAEVFAGGDPYKDLIRNVKLYLRVPTIREYWIIDISEGSDEPVMYVYRRRGSKWQQPIEVRYGETYTTKLLPGFELVLDPKT